MCARPPSTLTMRFLPAFGLLIVIASAALVQPRPFSAATCGEAPPSARPGPHTPTGSPGLGFEPSELDLGRLEPGERRSAAVSWLRTGPGPLTVLAVRPGCGCVEADGLPRDLPAGQAGRLRVTVVGPSRPGPFTDRVKIVTDAVDLGPQHASGIYELRIRGHVADDVVARPSELALGGQPVGTLLERRVEIVTTKEAARRPISCTLEGVAGDVRVRPPAILGRDGWCLALRLRIPRDPGPLRGVLNVDVGPRARLRIPVRGLAIPTRAPAPTGEARPAALRR